MLISPVAGTVNPIAPSPGVPLLILNAKTVLATDSLVISPASNITKHTFYFQVNAATPGTELTGAAGVYSASAWDIDGGWSPVSGGPFDLAGIDVPATKSVGQYIAFQFEGVYAALKVSITTVVALGTLSVIYVGEKS